jgi:hypothetical protein
MSGLYIEKCYFNLHHFKRNLPSKTRILFPLFPNEYILKGNHDEHRLDEVSLRKTQTQRTGLAFPDPQIRAGLLFCRK